MINKKSFLILTLLFSLWLVLVFNMPENLNFDYKCLYVVLLLAYLLFLSLILIVLIKKVYIFEPIIVVITLYLFIFFIRPCYDIIINGGIFSSSGTAIYEGGIKATILVVIGTGCMLLGYYSKSNIGPLASSEKFTKTICNQNKVTNLALLIWVTCLLLSMIYFVGSGFSIKYVLSAGMSGGLSETIDTGNLAFFSIFKSCLITSGLYILLFTENKLLKITTFFIGLMIFISMGGRALTLVFILTPIVYYYCSNNKRIHVSTLILGIITLVLLCVIMEATRTDIRSGNGFEMPTMNIELIMSPFDHELTTYKAFYGLVNAIPGKGQYCFGKGIFLYTLVMMIPRGIWPGKPSPPIYDVIRVSMDEVAVSGGAVYPNIGEFYAEFGIIGVMILMYVFGKYLKHLNNLRVYGERNSHALVLYSAEFSLLLQITIRGYTPSNFYQVLLTAVPVLLISNLVRGKNG